MKLYAGIGSRLTPANILQDMTAIAVLMAREGWTLRSGAAIGADTAFERGAGPKEIFTAQTDIPEWAFEQAERFHPAWHRCSDYAKRLHARNSLILSGLDGTHVVDRIICWTAGGAITGGTGQALRIAKHLRIPVLNLATRHFHPEAFTATCVWCNTPFTQHTGHIHRCPSCHLAITTANHSGYIPDGFIPAPELEGL